MIQSFGFEHFSAEVAANFSPPFGDHISNLTTTQPVVAPAANNILKHDVQVIIVQII